MRQIDGIQPSSREEPRARTVPNEAAPAQQFNPPGTAPFYVWNSIGRVPSGGPVSMDVFAGGCGVVKLNYDGHFGAATLEQSFGGKVSFAF